MCSVGDDNLEQNSAAKYLPEASAFKFSDNKCNKCKENTPQIVLRHKDAYCKQCFLAATIHKFKALLGKHRLIYPNDKVLIEHRGGHASTALLHFLRTGLNLSTPKRLRFQPVFIHVEDKYDQSIDARKEYLSSIKNEVAGQNFGLHFASLSAFLLNPLGDFMCEDLESICAIDDGDKIASIVDKKISKTNKEEFLNLSRRLLLIRAAKELECKCVFTTELALDIASQMLTDVSLGRGIHLPLNIGIVDDRDPEVKIIRPLRLFEIKELIFYNIFNKLDPVTSTQKEENPYSSVQNLMRNFVSNLQNNFPATITTIVRTGDKLVLDKSLGNNDMCSLCKGPIETVTSVLTSAESTKFSHWVSTRRPDYLVPSVERYNQTLESFSESAKEELCFACQKLNISFLKK